LNFGIHNKLFESYYFLTFLSLRHFLSAGFSRSQPGRLEVQYPWSHPWYEVGQLFPTPEVLKTSTYSGVEKYTWLPTPDVTGVIGLKSLRL